MLFRSKEFEKELAVIRGRVDGLEAKVGELEATQFSTTTKLQGQATFVIGAVNASGDSRGAGFNAGYPNYNNIFGSNVTVPRPIYEARPKGQPLGPILNQKDIERALRLNNRSAADKYNALYGATSFNYDLRLNFITSFTGKDQLYTRLRTGNFSNAFNGNGVNRSEEHTSEL